MQILILGGTGFLGRYLTSAALARGHEVTLFHRGKTGSDMFPDLEHLHGDRDGDLEPLQGRRWDAVIDTSAYLPRVVRKSAQLFADTETHYTFISTIMAYASILEPATGLFDESAPLATLDDPEGTPLTVATYGPLKTHCERIVEELFPHRSLIIRPCIIAGPHDITERFTYWVDRLAAGGEVLSIGRPDQPVQLVDVRDVAEWAVQMTEAQATGAYNIAGPQMTFGEMLQGIEDVTQRDATITWVDPEFVEATKILSEARLAYCIPLWTPQWPSLYQIDSAKAIANGFAARPLAATIRDISEWLQTNPSEFGRAPHLSRDEEAQILAQWKAAIAS